MNLEEARLNLKQQRAKIARLGEKLYVPRAVERIHRLALNPDTKVSLRDLCEKCGKPTHFTVPVLDRRAYWCGCE